MLEVLELELLLPVLPVLLSLLELLLSSPACRAFNSSTAESYFNLLAELAETLPVLELLREDESSSSREGGGPPSGL